MYCTAAYGTIRIIVAELPRQRLVKPSFRQEATRNLNAALVENFFVETAKEKQDSQPTC